MTTLIPAICKGDTLTLRKPLDLPDGTPVMVAVFNDQEREAWLHAGDKHFTSAIGSDEIQMNDEEWDRFVRESTPFASWREMQHKAVGEWAARKLQIE